MISTKINLEKLINTRTLEGITNKDGLMIRKNVLIRSGNLFASDKDVKYLYDNYNLRTVVDFRGLAEQQSDPDSIYRDIIHISNIIMPYRVEGITREKNMDELDKSHNLVSDGQSAYEHMKKFYSFMAKNSFSQSQYAKFLRVLIDNENGAVLWHCAVGKDRCGVGTALILFALDVDENTILEDYQYSNMCLHGYLEPLASSKQVAFDEVNKDYLSAYIASAVRIAGSMNNYIKTILHISDEDKRILKEKYLEK